MGNLINAVFFQRKQYTSGNYSVEFIFNDVRKRLSDKISASVFVSTYHSQGIFKRLYNMIEVMFNQGEVNFITGDIHYISFFLKKKRTILTILDSGFEYFMYMRFIKYPKIAAAIKDFKNSIELNLILSFK